MEGGFRVKLHLVTPISTPADCFMLLPTLLYKLSTSYSCDLQVLNYSTTKNKDNCYIHRVPTSYVDGLLCISSNNCLQSFVGG